LLPVVVAALGEAAAILPVVRVLVVCFTTVLKLQKLQMDQQLQLQRELLIQSL